MAAPLEEVIVRPGPDGPSNGERGQKASANGGTDSCRASDRSASGPCRPSTARASGTAKCGANLGCIRDIATATYNILFMERQNLHDSYIQKLF